MRYNDRNEFRQSQEWKNFRENKAIEQDYLDFVTGEPLTDNWNLHHLDLNQSHYFDISDPSHFVALNKTTHNIIHRLFLEDWEKQVLDEKEVYILSKMKELNQNNIEPLLFSCHLDYTFDHTNKLVTQALTKKLNIPCDRYGMVYWNPNTPGALATQPIDSVEWAVYMAKRNNWNWKDLKTAMELRHLCLYSSLKNLVRPEIKLKWNQNKYIITKKMLEKELKSTTTWIYKYKDR